MRALGRQRLRTRLRDLAAASAFASVALTGALPVPVLAAFGVCLALSLSGARPLGGRRAWSVLLLLAIAVGLFGAAFLGQLNLVVAAVSFAVLVAGHRMVSAVDPSTDQQVLLAALLLLAGGAALSGELWFALCLLAYAGFACLALGLSVVDGPGPPEPEVPVAPVVRKMSSGLAFAALGAVAFFVLFPRISWSVAGRRTAPGVLGGTTGMADRVRLGGAGSLKTSARVVARIALKPDPGVDSLQRYWVGRWFDAFDGREWRGTGRQRPATSSVRLRPLAPPTVEQRVQLLPAYDARTLFALDAPAVFQHARAETTSGTAPALLTEVVGEEVHFAAQGNGYSYTAVSGAPRADPGAQLDDPTVALALPPDLDERIAALALTHGGSGDPAQVAQRLEAWLKGSYAYSLELGGGSEEPLSEFLFETRRGHCEHFATALAVMLRTRGVPSRVVGGFFGGERIGDKYVLRAGDAHAWTQAFLEGRGWVTFDATPEAGRGGQPAAWLAALTAAYERLEELWRAKVIDYSIVDQVDLVRDLVRPPRASQADQGPGPRRPWGAALGAALLAFALVRALTRPRPPRAHPATSFLEQIEARLARARVAREEGEGLEETAARLARARHPIAPPLREATRRYLEARFGRRPLGRLERQRLLGRLARPPP